MKFGTIKMKKLKMTMITTIVGLVVALGGLGGSGIVVVNGQPEKLCNLCSSGSEIPQDKIDVLISDPFIGPITCMETEITNQCYPEYELICGCVDPIEQSCFLCPNADEQDETTIPNPDRIPMLLIADEIYGGIDNLPSFWLESYLNIETDTCLDYNLHASILPNDFCLDLKYTVSTACGCSDVPPPSFDVASGGRACTLCPDGSALSNKNKELLIPDTILPTLSLTCEQYEGIITDGYVSDDQCMDAYSQASFTSYAVQEFCGCSAPTPPEGVCGLCPDGSVSPTPFLVDELNTGMACYEIEQQIASLGFDVDGDDCTALLEANIDMAAAAEFCGCENVPFKCTICPELGYVPYPDFTLSMPSEGIETCSDADMFMSTIQTAIECVDYFYVSEFLTNTRSDCKCLECPLCSTPPETPIPDPTKEVEAWKSATDKAQQSCSLWQTELLGNQRGFPDFIPYRDYLVGNDPTGRTLYPINEVPFPADYIHNEVCAYYYENDIRAASVAELCDCPIVPFNCTICSQQENVPLPFITDVVTDFPGLTSPSTCGEIDTYFTNVPNATACTDLRVSGPARSARDDCVCNTSPNPGCTLCPDGSSLPEPDKVVTVTDTRSSSSFGNTLSYTCQQYEDLFFIGMTSLDQCDREFANEVTIAHVAQECGCPNVEFDCSLCHRSGPPQFPYRSKFEGNIMTCEDINTMIVEKSPDATECYNMMTHPDIFGSDTSEGAQLVCGCGFQTCRREGDNRFSRGSLCIDGTPFNDVYANVSVPSMAGIDDLTTCGDYADAMFTRNLDSAFVQCNQATIVSDNFCGCPKVEGLCGLCEDGTIPPKVDDEYCFFEMGIALRQASECTASQATHGISSCGCDNPTAVQEAGAFRNNDEGQGICRLCGNGVGDNSALLPVPYRYVSGQALQDLNQVMISNFAYPNGYEEGLTCVDTEFFANLEPNDGYVSCATWQFIGQDGGCCEAAPVPPPSDVPIVPTEPPTLAGDIGDDEPTVSPIVLSSEAPTIMEPTEEPDDTNEPTEAPFTDAPVTDAPTVKTDDTAEPTPTKLPTEVPTASASGLHVNGMLLVVISALVSTIGIVIG